MAFSTKTNAQRQAEREAGIKLAHAVGNGGRQLLLVIPITFCVGIAWDLLNIALHAL